MNGYEKRTNIKKEAIIESAKALFTAKGIQATSMNAIAKKAHVSQVSIYTYYGDKMTLAKEAFQTMIEAAMEKYQQILESDLPFFSKLENILQDKNELIKSVSTQFSKQALDDHVLQQVFNLVLQEKATILYQKFIDIGKKEGAICKDISDQVLLSYLLMSQTLLRSPAYLTSPDEYKRQTMNLILYGILSKE